FQRPLFAPLDERTNRGWRGVEDVDAMALDHLPEAIGLRPVWRAFIHQNRSAVREWTINHITVARDPADVGSTPVKIFVFKIEDPLRCEMRLQKITGGRVENSFRLTGRARSVENVERMFAVELFRGALRVDGFHQLMPPEIATGFHVLR